MTSTEPAVVPATAEPLPPWLRYLTHVMALGWATAELGWLGARATSFGFITLVLFGTEGTRAAAKLRRVLQP